MADKDCAIEIEAFFDCGLSLLFFEVWAKTEPKATNMRLIKNIRFIMLFLGNEFKKRSKPL